MVESGRSEEAEVAHDYQTTLAELRQNSKPHINMLTMLAEENATFAPAIADVIEAHIKRAEKGEMLPALYLVDSIIKNYKRGDEYKKAFERRIVEIFVHVFKNSDEKTRASMHKLRWTWNGFFPNSRLYRLDLKVHELDAQWPVTNPQASSSSESDGHKIHVNPKFVATPKPDSSRTVQPPSGKDPRKRKADDAKVGFLDEDEESAAKRPVEGTGTQGHLVKARNAQNRRRSPTNDVDLRGPPKASSLPLKKRRGDRDLGGSSESSPRGSHSSDVEEAPRGRKEDEDLRRRPAPSSRDAPSYRDAPHHRDAPPHREPPHREPPVRHPPPRHPPPRDLRDPRGRGAPPRPLGRPPIQPTSEPGTHAFLKQPSPTPMNGPAGLPLNGPIGGPPVPRGGGLLPAPDAHWNSAAPSNPPFRPLVSLLGSNSDEFRVEAPAPPPSFPGEGVRPSLPPVREETPAPGDAPKPPIPANNRIFVDGRAYEVQYIEDTPVIERNGLPHKIYFTGPPHDVVIDGVSHSLAFGDRKTVSIDGQPHSIRFGAPSRELYMGNYAFRGAFGGPPIFATINGHRHQISLCGPPPEVKIEPEPAHELMRFLNANSGSHLRGPVYDYTSSQFQAQSRSTFTNFAGYNSQPAPAAPTPAAAPNVDLGRIAQILENLKQSGAIKNIAQANKPEKPVAPAPPPRETTPPIRCQFSFEEDEVVERRAAPPPNLKDFSIRVLRIRFQSVIDALYSTAGQRCPNCGLRFEHMHKGTEDSRYQAHLDWHFRENSSRLGARGKSRHWFYPREDWVSFSEFNDPAAKSKSAIFEAQGAVQVPVGAPSRLSPTDAIPPVIADADGPQKCTVCAESFEKEWDDEEEYWLLKDAVRMDGQVYHPACVSDVSALNASVLNASGAPEDPTIQPFIPEGTEAAGTLLPGLSVKAEVKVEPAAFSNSAADPIVIDPSPVISIKSEPPEPRT